MTTAWKCHAKPAATGATCGHMNSNGGILFCGMTCCESCGCTKRASDSRRPKEFDTSDVEDELARWHRAT